MGICDIQEEEGIANILSEGGPQTATGFAPSALAMTGIAYLRIVDHDPRVRPS